MVITGAGIPSASHVMNDPGNTKVPGGGYTLIWGDISAGEEGGRGEKGKSVAGKVNGLVTVRKSKAESHSEFAELSRSLDLLWNRRCGDNDPSHPEPKRLLV